MFVLLVLYIMGYLVNCYYFMLIVYRSSVNYDTLEHVDCDAFRIACLRFHSQCTFNRKLSNKIESGFG